MLAPARIRQNLPPKVENSVNIYLIRTQLGKWKWIEQIFIVNAANTVNSPSTTDRNHRSFLRYLPTFNSIKTISTRLQSYLFLPPSKLIKTSLPGCECSISLPENEFEKLHFFIDKNEKIITYLRTQKPLSKLEVYWVLSKYSFHCLPQLHPIW